MKPVPTLPPDKFIVLFDGVCNLCDRAVQLIIAHDKRDRFRFVSLQSGTGQDILQRIGVMPGSADSMVLYLPGKAYYFKSDAALHIVKYLGWPGLSWFLRIFPKKLRDAVYDYIARNRYKWYGTHEHCLLPGDAVRRKFLE